MPVPLRLSLLFCGLFLLVACSLLTPAWLPPPQHPPEAELGEGRPQCTECHEARSEHVAFELYNHNPVFVTQHREVAYSSSNLCSMCHRDSFCSDCHASKSELKPSLRDPTGVDRFYPHRGDYLSRHRIEARLDPVSCVRCHGNPRAAQTCAPCHG